MTNAETIADVNMKSIDKKALHKVISYITAPLFTSIHFSPLFIQVWSIRITIVRSAKNLSDLWPYLRPKASTNLYMKVALYLLMYTINQHHLSVK